MSEKRQLNIELHMNRSQQAQAEAEAREDSKKTAEAILKNAEKTSAAHQDKTRLAKRLIADETIAQDKLLASQVQSATAIAKTGLAMMGLQSGQAIVRSIGEEFKRSSDYIQSMAKEFVSLQKTMQSVAAITGNKNSNAFTVSEATAGAAANLTPESWTQFRDAFMSKASNYVGDKASARLNTEDSNKFQASMAEFAKLHGVGAGEMADFAGGLLAQEKGPTTAAAMTAQAGKVFATLEASSKKVSGLLPGMTRIMAQGFSAAEAAPVLAMMPEIAPDEESTHLLRAISEIREVDNKGNGATFGITKGMSMNQKLESVVGSLHKQASENGKLNDEKLSKLLMDLTPETIAQNTLRGLVNKGPEGMNQWKAILASTPDDAVFRDISAGRKSDAGKVMNAEAQLALAKVKRGEEFALVEPELMKAQARAISSRRLDEFGMAENGVRYAAGMLTGVSHEQQITNQFMLEDVRGRAIRAGVNDPGLQTASRAGNDAILTQQLEVNKEIVRLLKLISEKEAPASAKIPAPVPGIPNRPVLRL